MTSQSIKPAVLARRAYLPNCTIGELVVAGHAWWAIERPWHGNDPAGDGDDLVSCIPEGTYICRRVMSPRFGDTFEVCSVPGRTSILFHAANKASDLLGCIGLGKQLSQSTYAVEHSRVAVAEFMAALAGINEFLFHVKQFHPEY